MTGVGESDGSDHQVRGEMKRTGYGDEREGLELESNSALPKEQRAMQTVKES